MSPNHVLANGACSERSVSSFTDHTAYIQDFMCSSRLCSLHRWHCGGHYLIPNGIGKTNKIKYSHAIIGKQWQDAPGHAVLWPLSIWLCDPLFLSFIYMYSCILSHYGSGPSGAKVFADFTDVVVVTFYIRFMDSTSTDILNKVCDRNYQKPLTRRVQQKH